ncbi:glycosyltransferase family 2 protein [Tabrizicola sp.]|uniref:glycosyltransferase family 2 protein n=1 Tax=Tabrizicola sp. TaxID=2005166 RepID=UPI003F3B6346
MMPAQPPVALASSMRNEGIHILEWLAYHRVIGFGPIVICTNDCDDGSDRLLDLLADHGEVDHLRNPVPQGEPPQKHGIARAMAHLETTPAEWLAHLDSDEFLNIAPGAAPVADLIARADDAHAIALPWLCFGDNGHAEWPGETLRAFTACEAAIDEETVKFKSLFRFRAFAAASDHMPTAPRIDAPLAVNSAGEPLSSAPLHGKPRSRYSPIGAAMRGGAVVNHYAVRSTDVFLLKNERGRGWGLPSDKYQIGSKWHRRANRNDRQDRTVLRRWPEVEAELTRLRALPGIAQAEAACIAWFQDRRKTLITPETIRLWTKGAA